MKYFLKNIFKCSTSLTTAGLVLLNAKKKSTPQTSCDRCDISCF